MKAHGRGKGLRNVSADRRRKDFEAKTDFQKWLKPYLKIGTEDEITYAEIFKRVEGMGMDYTENYIYRIVRGDPETFKNAVRPGYELAFAIGRIFGDEIGAIAAANYPIPGTENTNKLKTHRVTLATGDVIEINPDDDEPQKTIDATAAFLAGWRARQTVKQ